MAYRYRSRRQAKRLSRKSKRNFIITLIITFALLYSTVTWILPNFINGIGLLKNIIRPPQKTTVSPSGNATLAPPVLNIPYEATNSAQIDIPGFGIPNLKVKLFIDEMYKQTVDVSSDGSFTFEKVILSLGTNNIYGKTIDENGHESLPSKVVKIIYDSEKPPLVINEPEDGKKIQGGDKKVRVKGYSDPGVKIFINDTQVIVDKDGNFAFDQTLNDGGNTISIKAVDTALNTTEEERMVTYNP